MTADINKAERVIRREIEELQEQLADLESALKRLRDAPSPQQQPQQPDAPLPLTTPTPPRRHRVVRGGHNAQGGIERHGQEPWRLFVNRFR